MRPMSGRDPEAANPMNRAATVGAVEDKCSELALEVGLHFQEFETERLCVDR